MIRDQDVEQFLKTAAKTLLPTPVIWENMKAYVAQGRDAGGQLVVIRVEESVDVPEHQHDYDEFCLVLQGRVTTWIEGREYVSDPGDFLYEPANVPHRARIEGPDVAIDFFAGPRFAVEGRNS